MHDWRYFFIRHFTSFEGLDELGIAAALLVLAMFVLPRSERRQLKVPVLLLIIYLAVVVGHSVLVGPISPKSKVAIVSLLLLLTSLTRIAFLVVVDWVLVRWLRRDVPRIFRDILQGILFVGMSLALFRAMGVDLGSLLTTSAILTAVIGLSLQESLGNLVAGLAVRAERPFEVGDWVEIVDGQRTVGRVVEINWRATKLRATDHFDIVVPNGLIAKSTFRNYGRPEPITRRTVDFQGPYAVPPNQVRDVVLTALRGSIGVLTAPAPKLWLAGFADSGINYQVVYFLDDFAARSDIESNIRTRIWYALHRASISMPFPVRDVTIHRAPPPPRGDVGDLDAASRLDVLNQISLFDGIPESERQALAATAETMLYSAGESVLFEGDNGNDLFVVAHGEVIAVTQSPSGETIELARIGEGNLFGELSLLTGVRGATITAAKDTVVLRISHDEFRRIVAAVEGLSESLLTRLLERQNKVSRPEELGLDPSVSDGVVRTALFDRIRRFFAP
jgi:small-conductance mechanosensitive channel/CRP-like cAMP-binding protein